MDMIRNYINGLDRFTKGMYFGVFLGTIPGRALYELIKGVLNGY